MSSLSDLRTSLLWKVNVRHHHAARYPPLSLASSPLLETFTYQFEHAIRLLVRRCGVANIKSKRDVRHVCVTKYQSTCAWSELAHYAFIV